MDGLGDDYLKRVGQESLSELGMQSQSSETNMDESNNENVDISPSIRNVSSFSQSSTNNIEFINRVAESFLLSNIGIKLETKAVTDKEIMIEGIVKDILNHPKIKQWFYEALYDRLSKIVKEDNLSITIDEIDKEIKTLHDNNNIKQLTIKDIFLYKYENGKKLYEGNNRQLLELLNNNKGTDKLLHLLNKKYLSAFIAFISKMTLSVYKRKNNKHS